VRRRREEGGEGGREGRGTLSRDVPVYFHVYGVDAVAAFCLVVGGREGRREGREGGCVSVRVEVVPVS